MVRRVRTDEAPLFDELSFPISQAIVHGDTIHVSGQLGLDPETLELVEGGVTAQAEQSLRNIDAILGAAGGSLSDAVKVTVYLTDMDDLIPTMDVYERFVDEPYPARSTVSVENLPMGAAVEFDVTAARHG